MAIDTCLCLSFSVRHQTEEWRWNKGGEKRKTRIKSKYQNKNRITTVKSEGKVRFGKLELVVDKGEEWYEKRHAGRIGYGMLWKMTDGIWTLFDVVDNQ